ATYNVNGCSGILSFSVSGEDVVVETTNGKYNGMYTSSTYGKVRIEMSFTNGTPNGMTRIYDVAGNFTSYGFRSGECTSSIKPDTAYYALYITGIHTDNVGL